MTDSGKHGPESDAECAVRQRPMQQRVAADGYVVADADWETRDGHYKVRIPKVVGSADMEWVDVPDDALITEPNQPGGTHDGLADAVQR